jgi:hypothetical protein
VHEWLVEEQLSDWGAREGEIMIEILTVDDSLKHQLHFRRCPQEHQLSLNDFFSQLDILRKVSDRFWL